MDSSGIHFIPRIPYLEYRPWSTLDNLEFMIPEYDSLEYLKYINHLKCLEFPPPTKFG